MLAEWKPAYKRGFVMQAPLAIIGFVLGVIAWWTSGRAAFLIGAITLLANWPWTVLAIMPTNRALMATALEAAGPQSRALILEWNKLHGVRTLLGSLAVAAFLIALRTG